MVQKKIKICGLRRKEDITYVNECLPDYIGFVFAPSRRQVTKEQALDLKQILSPKIKAVGVFVNEKPEIIIDLVKSGVIDVIQLHGDETQKDICKLKKETQVPIIKAVRVKNAEDIKSADTLSSDYLLFDSYQKDSYGGTGMSFSWDMIPDDLQHPYFLAGGLNESNIEHALRIPAFGYDISGGVETEGVKDYEKIKKIMSMIR